MEARLAACIVIAIALAGCSSDEPEEAEDEGGGVAPSIEVPAWSVGDTWMYSVTDPEGQMSSMAMVVTAEDGSDYIVDTNEATVAYYHALDEISYLGKIRKSDLAGSQGSQRVQYFDFPLEQDKKWTTNWDGENVEITVVEITPDGARMQALAGERTFAEYTFGRGFLEDITFYDENGTDAYRMQLSDTGDGFSGTVYRYTILEALDFLSQDVGAQSVVLDVEGATELGIRVVADCGDAVAGRMGGTLSEKEADEPHLPQPFVATESPYAFEWDCSQGQGTVDEALIELDGSLVYRVDFGVSAPGGSIAWTLEPRIREAISI